MRWLLRLFHKSRSEDQLDRELRFHLEQQIAGYTAAGMSPEEARRRVRLEFGGLERVKEEVREAHRGNFIETTIQDVRFGFRMLRKNPGFTVVAVLTLALGIAVNTAVFTAINAATLRPLQVPHPDRMTNLYFSSESGQFAALSSYPNYTYYRDFNTVLAGLAAASGIRITMSGAPGAVQVESGSRQLPGGFRLPDFVATGGAEPLFGVQSVSENYFEVLGVEAALGRTFVASDNRGPGSDPYVLLSHNFWQRRFKSDPSIIGKIVRLNGVALTVIGITPHDFTGTAPTVPSAWVPAMMQPQLAPQDDWVHDRNLAGLRLYARLKPGVTREQAAQNLTGLSHQLSEIYPDAGRAKKTGRFVLTRGSTSDPPDPVEAAVVIFALTSVGIVLLIACANVASLMLTRAMSRQKEVAVRLALGAGRLRLIRQLLTESTLIGLAAGGLGLVFSHWLLRLLLFKFTEALPAVIAAAFAPHLAPDFRVFGYTLLVSFIASTGFGLAPALQSTKPNLTSALKEEAHSFAILAGHSRFKLGLRDVLVASQVALCLVLLITAALLARGSQRALTIDLGFNPNGLIALSLHVEPSTQYSAAKKAQIQRRLFEQLASLPSVRSVAVASNVPLDGGSGYVPVSTKLQESPNQERSPMLFYGLVSRSYFDTVGIPILRGRNFTVQEAKTGAHVLIVSEATARRLWPGQDAIGQQLAYGDPRPQAHNFGSTSPLSAASTVIGVAKDIRSESLSRLDDSYLYLPLNPDTDWGSFLLRTGPDTTSVMKAIQHELQSMDGNLTGTVRDQAGALTFNTSFVLSRLGALLSASIGFLGLILAAVGLYGTVGYAVTRRTREIGVRMALGARRSNVLYLVLRETIRPVALGLAVGLLFAFAASRLLVSWLFGLVTLDFTAFLGAGSVLCATSLLASYIPARRAMRVDPMVALRYE